MTAYAQNLETAGLADLLARGEKVRLTGSHAIRLSLPDRPIMSPAIPTPRRRKETSMSRRAAPPVDPSSSPSSGRCDRTASTGAPSWPGRTGWIALGAMLSLPALIAACSPSGSGDGVTIEWANWPAYIDIDEETGEYPTIVAFTEQTGNDVNYQESIRITPTSSPRSSPTCRMATTPVGT